MKIDIRNYTTNNSEIVEHVKIGFKDNQFLVFYPEKSVVHAIVDKFGNDYRIKVHLDTTANFICDTCLDSFNQDIALDYEQIYQIGQGDLASSDDVQVLPADTTEIDISDLLTEMVFINHPIKMLCKKECKGLCPVCGTNLNKETCTCTGLHDYRWEKLKNLIK